MGQDEGSGDEAGRTDGVLPPIQTAALEDNQRPLGTLTPEVAAAIMGVPMVLWAIDPSGEVTLSEGRGLAALGLKAGQLVGANVFDVYADSPQALGPIRQALQGTVTVSSVEVRGSIWENRYFPRIEAGEVCGLIGISLDVTEQREAESARRQADDRWRALAENAPDQILLLDRDLRIVFINRLERSASPAKVLGNAVFEFVDQEFHATAREAFDDVLAGATARSYESAWTHEPLGRRWYEVRVGPLQDGDAITGLVLVSTDITERRRSEAEQELLRVQLQHTQKLESLGILAGGIAHDFNNLLMSMRGHAELALLALPPTHPAHAQVGGVVTATERAAELCQQMLAYAGRGRFELRSLDLSELVGGMAQLLSVSVSKGVQLKSTLAAHLWPVRGDVAQLQQVAMNLITNASESFEGGTGHVELTTGCGHYDRKALEELALLESLSEGDYVSLEVSDTGVGMSEETRCRMFDPFFTTKVAGNGLGMASVLGIVRGHGGALSVRSELGGGTTVRVLLPRCLSGTGITAQTPTPSGPVTVKLGAGRTALVIDDEAPVRNVAVQMLQYMGFETLAADNGAAGLALYRERSDQIALVILDLTMPVMGGAETLQELRKLDPAVVVLLSSGYDEAESVSLAEVAGVLRKPYGIRRFEAALISALAG